MCSVKYLSLCISCCIIICFIFAWIFFYFRVRNTLTDLDEEYNDYNNGNIQVVGYYENERLCDEQNKYSVHPQSQTEEDLVINNIISKIKPICNFVFFGFVADVNIRYQSLFDNTTWPSLKIRALPFDFKLCYELNLVDTTNVSVTSVDNCGNQIGKSLLFLSNTYDDEDIHSYNELCFQYRFQCLSIYQSQQNDNVEMTYEKAKEDNSKLYNILPFDKDQFPEIAPWLESSSLTLSQMTDQVIVMAVKYKFVYKYYDKELNYTSKRFSVEDPEYNCIGYDIKKDKVVTKYCGEIGCLFCSNQSKVEEEE